MNVQKSPILTFVCQTHASPSFLASCPANSSYFNFFIFHVIQGFSSTSLPGSQFGKLPHTEKEGKPGLYLICLLSLEDCYPTISVVQCLRAIASYILPNFIVVSGRRVTTVSYPIMARSRIPFNVSLDFYSYVIKSKAERLKLKLLDLMHLKRNN